MASGTGHDGPGSVDRLPEDEYLTVAEVAEVAEILKPNQQTIRNWVDRGGLRFVRVGQHPVSTSTSISSWSRATSAAPLPRSPASGTATCPTLRLDHREPQICGFAPSGATAGGSGSPWARVVGEG